MTILLVVLLMVAGGGAFWALSGPNDATKKRVAAGEGKCHTAQRHGKQDCDQHDH